MTAPSHELREAIRSAVADGVRLYVPTGIGILVIGIPACALVSFLHFILGVSMPAAGATGAAFSVVRAVTKFIG